MCIILYETKKTEEVTIFLKNIFFWRQAQCFYTHYRSLENKNKPRLPLKRPKFERLADSDDKFYNVANSTVCL